MSTNTYPTAGTDASAHQTSNVVQMAQGIRGGTAPTNAQIQTELEATKQYLIPRAEGATTAKEEKTLHDARKLVEAAQTTLVVKNSDEKMQRLAAEMTSLGMNSGSSQKMKGKKGRKYNKVVQRLRDVTMSFSNSPTTRKAFMDLVRILREIFNVTASNAGLEGKNLRENLTSQLQNIRQSRQQGHGMGQLAGHGAHGAHAGHGEHAGHGAHDAHAGHGLAPLAAGHLAGQPGYGAPMTGTGLMPGQPGYVDPLHAGGHHAGTTGLLPGQPGYGAPLTGHGTGLMPGQPGYVDPHHGAGLLPGQHGHVDPLTGHHAGGALAGQSLAAQTGLLPGQPGYGAPLTGHGTGLMPGQPGYVDPLHAGGHHAGTTGLLPGQPGYGAPVAGTTGLLPGQPGYGAPLTGHGTGLLPGQPGYVDPHLAGGVHPGGAQSYAPNLMPTGGLLGAAAGAVAGAHAGAHPGQHDPTHVGHHDPAHHAQPGHFPGQHHHEGHHQMGQQAYPQGYPQTGQQAYPQGYPQGLPQGHGQGQLGGHGLSGAGGQPQQMAQQMAQQLTDAIPEEQKQQFVRQLKEFLHEVKANPETDKVVRELFSVWGSLNGQLYAQFDQMKSSTSGSSLPQTAKSVIEEFTGERTLDDFLEYLRYTVQIIDSDHELKHYLAEARDFLIMALEDPELIDSDDYAQHGSELLTRGRHITYKYRDNPTIVGLFEEARLLSEEIKNDVTLNLLKDRSSNFFANFVYKDPRTNTPKIDLDLVDRMRATLVPFIIDRIREIPIPRIEVSNKDFEYLIIDDLHLRLGNILPNQITIHSRSLAKLAAEARGAVNQIDAHAGSTRTATSHPEHMHGRAGDTSVHLHDDSRSHGSHSHDDDYSSSDDDTSTDSDDEYSRPNQVRVGGRDVTGAHQAAHPGDHAATHHAGTQHAGTQHVGGTHGGVDTYNVGGHNAGHTTAHNAGHTTAHNAGHTTAHGTAGSRIRFRIADIKPEFRNFYFSMKKIKAPALTDEGRMNMSLKGKGLTIVGAFSLSQAANGKSQITNQRVRVSLGRVKFDVLEAKHKMMLKMGFLFMGKTISKRVEAAIQEKLEKLVVEWSDVLNQKVMTHLPPVDQLTEKGVGAVTRVTEKVTEKTA